VVRFRINVFVSDCVVHDLLQHKPHTKCDLNGDANACRLYLSGALYKRPQVLMLLDLLLVRLASNVQGSCTGVLK
jgi:hypothetical protein